MATSNPPVSQTRAFSTVFLIEMWERFGFYGMQVLMVTYMMKKLGFVDTRANLVWGAAAALIYATPAIGGWIGDRLIGTRRTMRIGALVLASGYALLWLPTNNEYFLYIALGVIIVGNGFFKPNAGNLVRKIYEGDETRIDSAFTMYYMAVNIGSMISMTLTPWIRDYIGARYGDSAGWHTAFGVCSIGLIIGMVNYFLMSRALAHIGSPADDAPVNRRRLVLVLAGGIGMVLISAFILQSQAVARVCVYAAGAVILGIFVHLIRTSHRDERAGLIAALVLVVQTIFFFIFYQQMSTSLNLFAQKNVDLNFSLFGWHLFTWIPEQYQNLNSIWIVVLSPRAGVHLQLARPARQGPVDCGQVRLGLRRRGGRIFHLRRGCALGGQRPGVVVDHGLGLRPVLAGGVAGERSRVGDDRPLCAGAHGRLHDGSVFCRLRPVAVHGKRGGQFRSHTRGHHEPARIADHLYQPVQQTGLRRHRLHVDRDRHAAADESALSQPFRCGE